MDVLVRLVVALGMLAVLPMGLALVDEPGAARLRRIWWLPATLGAVSPWLPRGPAATALAACYAAATLALALLAPRRLLRTRSLAPREIAVLTALATPAVAGLALTAERHGTALFGFSLRMLSLTVPHFHFAGFAAALVAGLACRAGDTPAARCAALGVPAGTLLVLAGYFTGEWVEFAGAAVLTCGMWLVGLVTLRGARTADRTTRALLTVSAATLVATMLLALSWALGEASGLPHPTLTWMAATHGVGNALGFTLCALLAARRLQHSVHPTTRTEERS
ncbi:YndJ family protein [Streptomyces olivaceiscleroticus]|uniref:YndJ-like protein n=1 Tax=Streptomyces olivaceiscleroticus TaxID=68245 RepID=A0ABN0ZU93_9ACTN